MHHVQFLEEVLRTLKFLQVQELSLENTEKVLDDGVIEAVPLVGYTLGDVSIRQCFLVFCYQVTLSLIRVKEEFVARSQMLRSLIEHGDGTYS